MQCFLLLILPICSHGSAVLDLQSDGIQAMHDPHTFRKPGVHADFTDGGGSFRSAKLMT